MLSGRELAIRTILSPPSDAPLWQHSLETCWAQSADALPHPWRGLVAFDLARLALHNPSRSGRRRPELLIHWLDEAAEVPMLAAWPHLFKAVLLSATQANVAGRAVLSQVDLGQRTASPLRPATLHALGGELATLAVDGDLRRMAPTPIDWGQPSDWDIVRPAGVSLGVRYPATLIIEEFRELQREAGGDLFFCLPQRGTAWIRALGQAPQAALPQSLRILAALVEANTLSLNELRERALGPDSLPTAIDKALSRTRRLLQHMELEGECLVREGDRIALGSLTAIGLVSAYGRRPDVRVRGASKMPPPERLVGWASTLTG